MNPIVVQSNRFRTVLSVNVKARVQFCPQMTPRNKALFIEAFAKHAAEGVVYDGCTTEASGSSPLFLIPPVKVITEFTGEPDITFRVAYCRIHTVSRPKDHCLACHFGYIKLYTDFETPTLENELPPLGHEFHQHMWLIIFSESPSFRAYIQAQRTALAI